AGPILDGSGTDSNRVIVRNPEDARRVVDSLARTRVDFIKVHEHLSRDAYFAIAAEARKLGIPFVGHVPAGDTGFLVSRIWAGQAPKCPSPSIRIRQWLLGARMKGIAPLREAGIPLLAGTDVGFPYVIPGSGLHKELSLLVEAGLTPAQALAAATINPARFL